MRFVTPIVFFGTAAFLAVYNSRGADDILAFSFIPAVWPEAAGDPQKLSGASIALVAGMGAIFLVRDLLRSRRTGDTDE